MREPHKLCGNGKGGEVRKRITPGAILGTIAVVLALTGSAAAGALITSGQIKDGTIRGRDIHKGTITLDRLSPGVRRAIAKAGRPGPAGLTGVKGDTGAKGDTGPAGPTLQASPPFAQPNSGFWGVIDRNTIGSPNASLRSGPGTPPLGTGSLNLLVRDGTEKIAYGDEVDFAGKPLAGFTRLGYSVYQGFDYKPSVILPSIAFEVDPKLSPSVTYSSLVYVPPKAEQADSYTWKTFDATADPGGPSGWYFTNAATAAATQCGQAAGEHFCSWADVQAATPDAVVKTLAFSKGRDSEFTGAVDALRVNDTVYDFEESGVSAKRG
jgi:hypothetical protein